MGDNEEVVSVAVMNTGMALEHASLRMRADKRISLLAAKSVHQCTGSQVHHVLTTMEMEGAAASPPSPRSQLRHQLHAWQRYYNMEPRNDSHLTKLYIEEKLPGMPADEVARELFATEFLYQYTLYGCVLEGFLRRVACVLQHEYDISWKNTWHVVRFYGPLAMKLMALMSSGQCIPPALPPPPPPLASVPPAQGDGYTTP
jgi:hypothetical protein